MDTPFDLRLDRDFMVQQCLPSWKTSGLRFSSALPGTFGVQSSPLLDSLRDVVDLPPYTLLVANQEISRWKLGGAGGFPVQKPGNRRVAPLVPNFSRTLRNNKGATSASA